ncbi:MAG: hypothetical protein WC974_09345 [Thermoplasmata archaeon]
MKTLLMFFILCFAIEAQTVEIIADSNGRNVIGRTHTVRVGTTAPIYPIDFMDGNGKHHDVIKEALINLLTNYQDECYADSTEECFNVYVYDGKEAFQHCSNHDIDLGFNPAYKETRNIWTHKEPTFIGFIEWLKKESNK